MLLILLIYGYIKLLLIVSIINIYKSIILIFCLFFQLELYSNYKIMCKSNLICPYIYSFKFTFNKSIIIDGN